MTPTQMRMIERAMTKGTVQHIPRASLPSHVRADMDGKVPHGQAIVRHASTRYGDIYWYNDWVFEC